jgi:hypothetical protein
MDPATLAVGASIASVGFKAAGNVMQGKAAQSSAEAAASKADYDAARSERAAEFGRIKADQTDAHLREELAVTLHNIDAVRAASGVDPTSPTGQAIKDNETYISDRSRFSQVTSIRLQAEEDERAAGYSRSLATYQRAVGKQALKLGYLNAAGTVLGGIGSLGMSGGTSGAPTTVYGSAGGYGVPTFG